LLSELELTPSSVPPPGAVVPLRRTANISQGGTAADVTEAVHEDNRRAAEIAAQAIGLNVAGIDFITKDIAKSWKDIGGAIIEVNSFPGLRPHWLGNPARNVVGPIVDQLFPAMARGRIPTAAITGSIGKTTTARMVGVILAQAGLRVGTCTTEGVWVGDECLHRGDWAGGRAIEWLLSDRRVEAGVFEVARGGLLKYGMIADRFDVAAVLNVLSNHVGADGVQSRQDLAAVKSLLVRNASTMVVLNAEDELCSAMRKQVPATARLCLVGSRADDSDIGLHRQSGGCAVVLEGGPQDQRIALYDGTQKRAEIPVSSIPAALAGLHKAKVWNALFATAIAYGLGTTTDAIARGLATFTSSAEQNPARFNVIDQHPFRVILDKADGAEAVRGLADVARGLPVTGCKLLLLTARGNRPDDYIRDMGRAAAGPFDRYVCSSNRDLRGRAPHEVPTLLTEGLLQAGVDGQAISRIENEDDAVVAILSMARAGDLVLLSLPQSGAALKTVTEFTPGYRVLQDAQS
jgi:cyanophycin synthetase